jgi:hypothetical protein
MAMFCVLVKCGFLLKLNHNPTISMRLFAIAFIILSVSSGATAQRKQDIFNSKTEVTWLGLDFSKAKFIGDRERLGSEADVKHLMEALNDLIFSEKNKYDISGAIDKPSVETDTDVTKQHNANLNVQDLFSSSEKDYIHLKQSDIPAIVSAYDRKGKQGIGLIFIIESFSKLHNEASIWVTFVNMETKEVLLTERMTGIPKGFGLRNYWGGAIYDILKKMKKEFEMWRKKNS